MTIKQIETARISARRISRHITSFAALLAGMCTAAFFPASVFAMDAVQTNLDIKTFQGKRLLDVLNLLNQHDYKIIFSSSQIKEEMIVGKPLSAGENLDQEALVRGLLAQFQLGLKIGLNGSLIVIKNDPSSGVFQLRGQVHNLSAEQVSGAIVELAELSGTLVRATLADAQGQFDLTAIPRGRYQLSVEAPGYLSQQSAIDFLSSDLGQAQQNINIELHPLPLEKITVTTNQYDISYAQSNDQQFMQQQDIERLSHLANDINRALAHVPGIAGGDFSAQLHIRGGATEENSFVFDGMPLYDPFHMKESGSFFTVIDAFTIGAAEIITGGATAEFGDHLSGVINLTSKNWDEDLPTALGINFLHAKVRASGQLGSESPQDNWLVSARHGFMRVVGAVSDVDLDNYNPAYTDFFAKANKQISDNTMLTWHSLITLDKGACFNQCVNGHDGKDLNQYHWLSAKTQWQDNLTSTTLLGHGDLAFTRNGIEQNEIRFQLLHDELDWDFTLLKQDWRYSANDRFLIKGGVEARELNADYRYSLFLNQQNLFIPLAQNPQRVEEYLHFSENGNSYAAYMANMFRMTPHLTAELGVRWDKQSYLSGSQISPRLHLDYLHPKIGNIKASYGIYHQAQGIQQLLVESQQQDYFEAQKVDQFNLSYQNRLGRNLSYKLSLYHKHYDALSPRIESQFGDETYIFEGRPDRIVIDPESATSKGIEIGLQGSNSENFNWWFSYAYNRTQEKENGQWYERQWDQRHSLNFAVDYQFRDACHANVAANYHSGWRYTPVVANQAAADGDLEYPFLSLGRRYSARYPDFFSVDMRVGCEYRWAKNRLRLFVEVVNLLNRKNIVSQSGHYLQYSRAWPIPRVIRDDSSFIPRIPSIGILWEF